MHQVRYFLAVADQLNFTRAAEVMHVAQPSLTRAIQKLEDELGGPLFRRERGNTHLTELGRLMRPHLAATLEAAETAKRKAQSFRKRESGQLIIGACRTVCAELAIPYIASLTAEMPGLDIQIDIRRGEDVAKGLIAGDMDAAILGAIDAFPEERFDETIIRRSPFVVAFSEAHRFNNETQLVLESLDGEGLVVRTACQHEEAVAAAMEARRIVPNVRHRSSDERWLSEMVRQGLGCRVLPEPLAQIWNLRYRVLHDLPLQHRISLTTMAGRRHSPALASLVKLVRAMAPTAPAPQPAVADLSSQ